MATTHRVDVTGSSHEVNCSIVIYVNANISALKIVWPDGSDELVGSSYGAGCQDCNGSVGVVGIVYVDEHDVFVG